MISPLNGRNTINRNLTIDIVRQTWPWVVEYSNRHTIDVDKTGAMTDQAVGRLQQVIKADTEANFLDHLGIYQPKNI